MSSEVFLTPQLPAVFSIFFVALFVDGFAVWGDWLIGKTGCARWRIKDGLQICGVIEAWESTMGTTPRPDNSENTCTDTMGTKGEV